MGYTALYRKFRPKTFGEMVGQEHITRTLKNQIIADRIGHAYLFNGDRGTGKTSTAKVFARAINCLNPKDGEPCNECEVCKAAISGSLTDIVEIDAASNNKVDDVRIIREEVNYLPSIAKYRVYIIDEVHMLTTEAFNALLNTLEEPPKHVKFILATTEPQKLPATILSRCQRFDFKKISVDNIIKRLKIVCKESSIAITEEALKAIAVLAEGALRDALSILERCIQDGDTKIDVDKVKELVGIPKLEYINKLTSSIVNYDVESAINVIEEVLNQGKDVNNFNWELIKYIKDILLYKTSKKLNIYNEKEIKEIDKIAEKISKERLLKIIYNLSELEYDLKNTNQKTIVFESRIIKLCINHNEDGIEELKNRIKKLEDIIETGNIKINNNKENKVNKFQDKVKYEINPVNTNVKKQTNNNDEKNNTNANAKVLGFWPDIVADLKAKGKMVLFSNLVNSRAIELNDMTIGIDFPNGLKSFGKTIIEQPEHMQELEREVSIAVGKPMRVKVIDKDTNVNIKKDNDSEIMKVAKKFDVPINFIDE